MSINDLPMSTDFEMPEDAAVWLQSDKVRFQDEARDIIERNSDDLTFILQDFCLGGDVTDIEILKVVCRKDGDYDGYVDVSFTDEQNDHRCSSVRKTESRAAMLRFTFNAEDCILTVWEMEPEIRAPDE